MANSDAPYLLVSAIVKSGANPAAATRSHGDAMERAIVATGSVDISGMDLVELGLAPQPFDALRKQFALPEDTVAIYDIFPVPSGLKAPVRMIAGQYFAAELLWALQTQGSLAAIPFNLNFSLPKGWNRVPKQLQLELKKSGALTLSEEARTKFDKIKTQWSTHQG